MKNIKYVIEYYNKVYEESYTIEKESETEAILFAKSIQELVEIKNVKVFEIKQIKIQ